MKTKFLSLLRLGCLVICLQLGAVDMVDGNGLRTEQDQQYRGRNSVLQIGPEVLRELSREEQEWYHRFQEGVIFFDGWSAISEELLAVFPEEQWRDRQAMMQRLGVKIGTEWAKENAERKIDTAMLQHWGDQLRIARQQGSRETLIALRSIEREVDGILQGKKQLSQVSGQDQ